MDENKGREEMGRLGGRGCGVVGRVRENEREKKNKHDQSQHQVIWSFLYHNLSL